MDKKYKGAPFGTQTARFDVSGMHPKNIIPGTFTQTPYCKRFTDAQSTLLGPGRYDTDNGTFSERTLLEKSSGPGWARQYEVARMAALPHLLHKEQWHQKRLLRRKLGPGSYDLKDFLEVADEKPTSIHGICETKEERFKDKIRDAFPGPGTYGAGGVPHRAAEEKSKKSGSTVGLLDAGSSGSRTLPTVGSNLGPGNYNFTSFADEIIQKVTSVRGPYDVFSEDRNKPMKTGHFAAPNHANLGPGYYEVKSCFDDWNSRHKAHHGKFNKLQKTDTIEEQARSETSKNTILGPGSYDLKETAALTQAKKLPPFMSSAPRSDRVATKFFTGNHNPVGPGRYDVQRYKESQYINGHVNVFRSRCARPSPESQKFLRERLRGKNIKEACTARRQKGLNRTRSRTAVNPTTVEQAQQPCVERALTAM